MNSRGLRPSPRLAAVIGSPVMHSLSPAMHNSAFGRAGRQWQYFALNADESSLRGVLMAVRELPFGGLSVTTPLKEAVIEHLDEVSTEAGRLRSVNCIVVRDGRLAGHSTDGAGCVGALETSGLGLRGAAVTLLGAGATARAIASALCAEGASVTVVNRTRDNAERLCIQVGASMPDAVIAVAGERAQSSGEAVSSADVVVNATTVGMNGPPGDPPVVEAKWLRADQTVIDAVYQPLETSLLRAARERGATTVDGLWMLVHQAVRQHLLWFGDDDVDPRATALVMRAAAERELALRHR